MPAGQGPAQRALSPSFYSRSTCLLASGGILKGHARVAGGVPAVPLDAAQSCVEAGHPGSTTGTVYVDVDNPRIWTNAVLASFPNSAGALVRQEYDRPSERGFGFVNGDIFVSVSGKTHGPAANALLPWSSSQGSWTSKDGTVLTITPGARVGSSAPIEVELDTQGPRPSARNIAGFPVSLELDPRVILVPVQVYVFHAANSAPTHYDESSMLALWDRVPTTQSQSVTDGFGDTTSVMHTMGNVVAGGEVPTRASGHIEPDDVWAPCGVQFRLMKVVSLAVEQKFLAPTGHTLTNSALHEFLPVIQNDPNFDPKLLTVVFAPFCADTDMGDQGGPYPGQSLVGDNLSCVRQGAGGSVLAHELGHVIMELEGHPTCTSSSKNLMCAVPGSNVEVDPSQCATARKHLASIHMDTFFARLQAPLPAPLPTPNAPLPVNGAASPANVAASRSEADANVILVRWTPSGSHLLQLVWRRSATGHWVEVGAVGPNAAQYVNFGDAAHPERMVAPDSVYEFEVCDQGGGCSPLVTETTQPKPQKKTPRRGNGVGARLPK